MKKYLDYFLSLTLAIFSAVWRVHGYGLCANVEYHYMSPGLQTRYQCQMFKRIMEGIEDDRIQTENVLSHIQSQLYAMDQKMDTLKSGISDDIYQYAARDFPRVVNDGTVNNFQSSRDVPLLEDCLDLYEYGVRLSGVYAIQLKGGPIVMTYCDMETEGGGWTVIQNRFDGSVNFSRNWDEYMNGFGNPNGEFWLGTIHLNTLTTARNFTLRIDMSDWENQTVYAEYVHFRVEDLQENFRLHIGGYRGTAGDSFRSYHTGMQFSTPDSDNDLWYAHCAEKAAAGWWFRSCGYSSLNGRYNNGGKIPIGPDGLVHRGVLWYSWKNDYLYSLKSTSMKIRRKMKT